MTERVFITGAGLVSGLGSGLQPVLAALREGRSAVRVEDSSLEEVQHSPQARRMARASLFALAAARQALHSGRCELDPRQVHDDFGVVCASTHLATSYGFRFHEGFLAEGKPMPGPIHFTNGCFNSMGTHISLEYRLTGCNHTLVGGMNIGLHALLFSFRLLRQGSCTTVLCCASEELTDILAGVYRKFRLSPPLAMSEGGAALLLEKESRARARRAPILAEVLGGRSTRGPDIRRDVEGRALALAIEAASRHGPPGRYASCANGSDLDDVERSARHSVLPREIPSTAVKNALEEGFAFTSLAQAVWLSHEIAQTSLMGIAASLDRRGDATALALRGMR